LEAQYADELVNEGKQRLGTLRDYRNKEKVAGGQLDELVGTAMALAELEHARTPEEIPAFMLKNRVRYVLLRRLLAP
jgi:hypothetical protein